LFRDRNGGFRPGARIVKKSSVQSFLFLHLQPILPRSIMVVREILVLYVRVRILARQHKKGRLTAFLFLLRATNIFNGPIRMALIHSLPMTYTCFVWKGFGTVNRWFSSIPSRPVFLGKILMPEFVFKQSILIPDFSFA
jgi:hypothetical protein